LQQKQRLNAIRARSVAAVEIYSESNSTFAQARSRQPSLFSTSRVVVVVCCSLGVFFSSPLLHTRQLNYVISRVCIGAESLSRIVCGVTNNFQCDIADLGAIFKLSMVDVVVRRILAAPSPSAQCDIFSENAPRSSLMDCAVQRHRDFLAVPLI
jgi:hypothetical protein